MGAARARSAARCGRTGIERSARRGSRGPPPGRWQCQDPRHRRRRGPRPDLGGQPRAAVPEMSSSQDRRRLPAPTTSTRRSRMGVAGGPALSSRPRRRRTKRVSGTRGSGCRCAPRRRAATVLRCGATDWRRRAATFLRCGATDWRRRGAPGLTCGAADCSKWAGRVAAGCGPLRRWTDVLHAAGCRSWWSRWVGSVVAVRPAGLPPHRAPGPDSVRGR